MAAKYTGRLADPAFRHERAQRAARRRTETDFYIDKVVAAAPELTSAQRDRLAPLLRSLTADERGADRAA